MEQILYLRRHFIQLCFYKILYPVRSSDGLIFVQKPILYSAYRS